MTISRIMEKMIAFSDGNIHDIDHFIRVWTYARIIGELENIDDETLFILEIAPSMPQEIRKHKRQVSGDRGHTFGQEVSLRNRGLRSPDQEGDVSCWASSYFYRDRQR